MEIGHIVGLCISIGILLVVGVRSMRKVKNASDFDTGGGKGGIFLVCGALLGTLIGGQSTVGTAQLAYTYGLSAIWFTLGAGLGTLTLCLLYVIPLRKSRDVTLLEVIRDEYGEKAEYLGSVLSSLGMLISVISNVVASSALIMALTGWPLGVAALASVMLMCFYVVFGGAWGAEMGGVVKLALLFFTAIVSAAVILYLSGGPEFMGGTLQLRLSDIFSRGVGKDLTNCLSMVLGVLSTQTYAQAVWSAKNYHVARKATLLCGFLCIPVGLVSVLIGLFMRGEVLANSAEAFPEFLLHHMPPVIGGIGLGALLITVVTGGGGLSLGVSTIFVRDILGHIAPRFQSGPDHIRAMRGSLLAILALAGLVATLLPGALINDLGFLSMGLRGTVIFIPLTLALFFKGRFAAKPVVASMIIGPAVMIFGNLFWFPVDPLAGGILICILVCMCGYRKGGATLS